MYVMTTIQLKLQRYTNFLYVITYFILSVVILRYCVPNSLTAANSSDMFEVQYNSTTCSLIDKYLYGCCQFY